jgi:tetratricopeptide (TPR) repeat protein
MDAYFELAFAYERSGDVKESIRTLQELEAQFGEDEGILMEEYRVYLRSGQLEEAIEVLSRLIAANPCGAGILWHAVRDLRDGRKDRTGRGRF